MARKYMLSEKRLSSSPGDFQKFIDDKSPDTQKRYIRERSKYERDHDIKTPGSAAAPIPSDADLKGRAPPSHPKDRAPTRAAPAPPRYNRYAIIFKIWWKYAGLQFHKIEKKVPYVTEEDVDDLAEDASEIYDDVVMNGPEMIQVIDQLTGRRVVMS